MAPGPNVVVCSTRPSRIGAEAVVIPLTATWMRDGAFVPSPLHLDAAALVLHQLL